MEKLLRRLIGEDIRLAVAPGADLGRVRADPGQIEQVIMNLAVNARDAMPNGGRLVIETSNLNVDRVLGPMPADLLPGPHVLLTVSDTGEGMSAETAARVFEPFFTTKPMGKGTGLGLAVVYGIVKQSGGSISVYSEPGRGTTFKIYLPRADGVETETVESQSPPQGGTETILVVEDEPVLRDVAAEVLRSAGYTVLEASSPSGAILAANVPTAAIDLVVSDVVLPGGSGLDAARGVTARHPKAKVLLVSGYTDGLLDDGGTDEQRVPFLGKPYTPDGLLRKVREVLEGGS
jgi:CheY-like chemotaxis protein